MTSTANPNPSPKSPAAPPARKRHRRPDNWRETVESVVVAFVLAFLIRAFEAEAFVIPTGSMAPTLMGRHKDVTCRQCGYDYRVGTGEHDSDDDPMHAVCPNCRFTNLTPSRSFNGDRILVLKFPYAFSKPDRWDVSVFHYPEEAAQNYIKRLVGIGPEQIRIYAGDVYRRDLGASDWQILRKLPAKQQVLQMLVYDNDYPAPTLAGPAWQRWSAAAPGDWVESPEHGFECPATEEPARLQYRHLVPEFDDWDDPARAAPMPRLVTDFYAYNASDSDRSSGLETSGAHWVGDLTLSFDVELLQPGGELVCELNEGIAAYQCRFDLETGRATLRRQIRTEDAAIVTEASLARADTPLKGTGTHRVRFANVDDRLFLWIDGSLVSFGTGHVGVEYRAPHLERLALRLLAENAQASHVVVLYPDAGPESASQALAALLRSLLEAYGGPPVQLVWYRGAELERPLTADERVAFVLLGDAAQKRALLQEHLELFEDDQVYATGVDTSHHDFTPAQLQPLRLVHPSPTPRDLVPAEITATAARLRVSRLRLDRDVYYVHSANYGTDTDYPRSGSAATFYSDPARWSEAFAGTRDSIFTLDDGQYMMLGDNSPRSKDSRGWDSPEVVEDLLIGRAYFIYWPHGKPLLGIPRAPALWPHFKRMQFIR